MNIEKLNLLIDIYINDDNDDEDVREYFLKNGENPEEIIERGKRFIKRKEAEIKLKAGKEKQNKAKEFLQEMKDLIFDNNIGEAEYAYRKKSGDDNEEELKKQAAKLDELKRRMNGNE